MARIWMLLPVAAVVLFPMMWGDPQSLKLLTLLGIYVLLAMGMNIVWGLAGQISLGQNGLFAIGAYGSGILTAKASLPFLLAVPAAAVLGGLAACLIALPALRVRGFYLAMVTLGFGMLVQTVANEWADLTGGVQGLENIPSPAMMSLQVFGLPVTFTGYYYMTFALVAIGLLLARNLIRSYWGRAMNAVRESELAAAAQGIFVGKVKVVAFVIGGMYTGVAGSLYAHQIAFVSPDAFNVDVAILIMIMPLVGGLGTLWGPVVGAAIFLLLPELLQGLWQYNLLIYGLILISSFVLFPQGVMGGLRRWARPRRAPAIVVSKARLAPQPQAGARASKDSDPILQARNIGIHFGGLWALDGVDLELMPGRVHAVIGPNGSGKSTLMNVLTRIYMQSRGTTRLDAASMDDLRPDQAARAGLARTFQNLRLFPDLSAMDNVLIGAHPRFGKSLLACLLGTPGARREEAAEREEIEALLDDFGLEAHDPSRVGSLSYGDQKLVELARAVAKQPRLLLLDEPAAGLSSEEIETIRRTVRAAAAQGTAVLVIEHNMDFVMGIADTITVLDRGKKISEGPPATVRNDQSVIDAYLGTAQGAQGA